jgi:pyrroline-5-carboxylate reductase
MTNDVGGGLVLAGAGRMGGALLRGWLSKGLPPARIYVRDPHLSDEMTALAAERGLVAGEGATPQSAPSVIVVAVKPQVIEDVLPGLAPFAGPDTVVLSIAAGRTIASIAKHFPAGTAVVRSMPNTPAAIGRGITVACANSAASSTQKELCQSLLSAVGEVDWVEDEALMDAVTAVSGSGPAYVFLLAECLAEAGRAAGLDHGLALRLARATVSGSGELIRQSELDLATLRRNVTSPGGTTAAALERLMGEAGLKELMTEAVLAAARRSRELSA